MATAAVAEGLAAGSDGKADTPASPLPMLIPGSVAPATWREVEGQAPPRRTTGVPLVGPIRVRTSSLPTEARTGAKTRPLYSHRALAHADKDKFVLPETRSFLDIQGQPPHRVAMRHARSPARPGTMAWFGLLGATMPAPEGHARTDSAAAAPAPSPPKKLITRRVYHMPSENPMVLVMGYESKDYGPKVDAGRPASPPRVGEVRPARTRSAAAVMTQPHVARDSAAYEQMIKRAYEAPKSGGGAPTPFMHRILDRMAHPGLAFQISKRSGRRFKYTTDVDEYATQHRAHVPLRPAQPVAVAEEEGTPDWASANTDPFRVSLTRHFLTGGNERPSSPSSYARWDGSGALGQGEASAERPASPLLPAAFLGGDGAEDAPTTSLPDPGSETATGWAATGREAPAAAGATAGLGVDVRGASAWRWGAQGAGRKEGEGAGDGDVVGAEVQLVEEMRLEDPKVRDEGLRRARSQTFIMTPPASPGFLRLSAQQLNYVAQADPADASPERVPEMQGDLYPGTGALDPARLLPDSAQGSRASPTGVISRGHPTAWRRPMSASSLSPTRHAWPASAPVRSRVPAPSRPLPDVTLGAVDGAASLTDVAVPESASPMGSDADAADTRTPDSQGQEMDGFGDVAGPMAAQSRPQSSGGPRSRARALQSQWDRGTASPSAVESLQGEGMGGTEGVGVVGGAVGRGGGASRLRRPWSAAAVVDRERSRESADHKDAAGGNVAASAFRPRSAQRPAPAKTSGDASPSALSRHPSWPHRAPHRASQAGATTSPPRARSPPAFGLASALSPKERPGSGGIQRGIETERIEGRGPMRVSAASVLEGEGARVGDAGGPVEGGVRTGVTAEREMGQPDRGSPGRGVGRQEGGSSGHPTGKGDGKGEGVPQDRPGRGQPGAEMGWDERQRAMRAGAQSPPRAGRAGAGPSQGDRRVGAAKGDSKPQESLSEDSPARYELSVRLHSAGSLAGWLFDVYVTDLTQPRHGTVRVAGAVPVDPRTNTVLVPTGRSATAAPVERGAPLLGLRARPESAVGVRGVGEDLSPVLDPTRLLPWVQRPRDLASSVLRVEVVAVAPHHRKVATLEVSCGDRVRVAPQARDLLPELSTGDVPLPPGLSQHLAHRRSSNAYAAAAESATPRRAASTHAAGPALSRPPAKSDRPLTSARKTRKKAEGEVALESQAPFSITRMGPSSPPRTADQGQAPVQIARAPLSPSPAVERWTPDSGTTAGPSVPAGGALGRTRVSGKTALADGDDSIDMAPSPMPSGPADAPSTGLPPRPLSAAAAVRPRVSGADSAVSRLGSVGGEEVHATAPNLSESLRNRRPSTAPYRSAPQGPQPANGATADDPALLQPPSPGATAKGGARNGNGALPGLPAHRGAKSSLPLVPRTASGSSKGARASLGGTSGRQVLSAQPGAKDGRLGRDGSSGRETLVKKRSGEMTAAGAGEGDAGAGLVRVASVRAQKGAAGVQRRAGAPSESGGVREGQGRAPASKGPAPSQRLPARAASALAAVTAGDWQGWGTDGDDQGPARFEFKSTPPRKAATRTGAADFRLDGW